MEVLGVVGMEVFRWVAAIMTASVLSAIGVKDMDSSAPAAAVHDSALFHLAAEIN